MTRTTLNHAECAVDCTRKSPRGCHHRGFTIVELLVVIGIIAILVSLTSVALSQAGGNARQARALSNLKQVGTAWIQYANQNDDRAMLGYADPGVQSYFKMRTKDRAGQAVAAADAAYYPHRLLPFLGYDRSLMYDYISEYEDVTSIPNDVIALNPAWGYNAYYLGGWWEMQGSQPTMRYGATAGVVCRSLSQIERTTEMIVFCASSYTEPGLIKAPDELRLGSSWVCPHILGTELIWRSTDGGNFGNVQVSSATAGQYIASLFSSPNRANAAASHVQQVQGGGAAMEVVIAQSVPTRRIKNFVQTVRADMSTALQGFGDLMDQRKFINAANRSSDPYSFGHN
jgi:prepilin-type N-terminal cleavage/methylation domain-containing protein